MGKRSTSKKALSTGWSGGRGATGSRQARAPATNAASGGEGVGRPPALSVLGAAIPPLGTCDVRAFHRCYIVARGRAPVRETERAGAGGPGFHRAVPARAASPHRALPGPPPAFWPASPHSGPPRALPKYGAAVLRGHPARAPGRAGPAAVGGPACPAEPAPPGGALPARHLLLPVRAEGDQAPHAEDAGVLDAGGTAWTCLPSPAGPASSAPDIPGPPFWDIWSQQQSARCFSGPNPWA